MRPTQIQIENFLSYENSGKVEINNKTIIVGENNAGKSNFVDALRTFFRFSSRRRQDLDKFHNRDEDKQIQITVWFDQLCDEEREEFDEGLDEPSTGELAVRLVSEYNSEEERAETNDYQRLTDSENNEWKKKTGLANTLDGLLPKVAHYEAERELDDAAKTSNKSSLLFKLLGSAYDDIPQEDKEALERRRDKLQEQLGEETPTPIDNLVTSLDEKMNKQVTMDGELDIGFDIPEVREMVQRHATVWTDEEQADEIADMGSGSRMSFLLSCIWEMTKRETDDVFLTLEEPENYLHPHSVRQLSATIDDLAGDGDFVFLTTHSPELASVRDIGAIKRIKMSDGSSEVQYVDREFDEDDEEQLETVASREVNELFFSRAVIVCEGSSDRDALRIADELTSRAIPDRNPLDAEGVSVIEAGGKDSVPLYLKLADQLDIPSVALLDDDNDDESNEDIDEELVSKCEELSKRFFRLEEDLEHSFLEKITIETFHKSMERLEEIGVEPGYDENLEIMKEEVENNPNTSMLDKKISKYEHYNPSKPPFARQVARRSDVDTLPDKIQDVVEAAVRISE